MVGLDSGKVALVRFWTVARLPWSGLGAGSYDASLRRFHCEVDGHQKLRGTINATPNAAVDKVRQLAMGASKAGQSV